MNTPNDFPLPPVSPSQMQADLLAILLKSAPSTQAAASPATTESQPTSQSADTGGVGISTAPFQPAG